MKEDRRDSGVRLLVLLVPVLILLQGCFSGFTEEDDGDSSKILSGRTFVVSLPACDMERVPQIKNGEIVRFLGSKKDGNRDVFEFKAAVAGETEIKISKYGDSSGPFYTFTPRVVLGGSPY